MRVEGRGKQGGGRHGTNIGLDWALSEGKKVVRGGRFLLYF